MKSILLSTRPKWCEKICHEIGTDKNGKPIYEKEIEVRKTKPSIPTPFKVFIYETYDKKYDGIGICWGKGKCFEHGCKKVIGEFVCDKVYKLFSFADDTLYDAVGFNQYLHLGTIEKETCLTQKELCNYGKGKPLYGWHISQLKIYDKPKELNEFRVSCRTSCKNCKNPLYYDGRCEEDNVKILIRPPQSWCYVQELGERK